MAEPNSTRDRREGASSFDADDDGKAIKPKVGVYDRPANAGQRGGMSTMTMFIGLLVLLILAFVVWQVVF